MVTMVKMKMRVTKMTILLVMVTCLTWVSGFNLAPAFSRLLQGSRGTYYGYSVALWADRGGEKRLVVGAPRGKNSTAAKHTLPLGNVHICNAFSDSCPSDPRAPTLSSIDYSEEAVTWGPSILRQGIGFGETIYTRNDPESKLVVCAPRYSRKTLKAQYIALEPRGVCFILPSYSSDYIKINPFPEEYHYIGRKPYRNNNAFNGFALGGMSSCFSRDQLYLYMGGPYSYYGQGTLMRTRSSGDSKTELSKITYGTSELDFVSEGWALVAAKFDGKTETIATSSPNSADALGSVAFYTNRLAKMTIAVLYGEDVGAKFGYSLASGDIDGDGAADLLVGAPLAPRGSGTGPDAGKVFLYYAPCKANAPRASPLVLEGHEPWGHFGHAVTSPGDLNQDGFEDVVIGAPGGLGRLYVYNGGVDGLHQEPTQVLRASEFSPGLRGFGFSLDGGIDMDNNGYPDLIVGAAESDTAVFLRSAPVVTLEGSLVFDPPVINLEDRSCATQGETTQDVACSDLVLNFQYTAKGINTPLEMKFEIELDSEERRLAFLDPTLSGHKHNVTLNVTSSNDDPQPWRLPVFLKRSKYQNKIPATASVSIALLPVPPQQRYFLDAAEGGSGARGSAPTLAPPEVPSVLDPFKGSTFSAELRLDCADVTTCFSTPDLVLQADGPRQLVVGGEQLVINVQLSVRNDSAFNVKLFMVLSSGLQYQRVASQHYLPMCRVEGTSAAGGHSTLVCSFTSDLLHGDEIPLTFLFHQLPVKLLTNSDPHLTFHLNVTSDSKDLNDRDNIFNLTIRKAPKVNLFIDATSEPEAVEGRVNESLTLEQVSRQKASGDSFADQLGPRIRHSFSIANHGPSPLLAAKVEVQVPRTLPFGMPFYLVEGLHSSGPVTCTPLQLNPLNFKVASDRGGGNQEEIDRKGQPDALTGRTTGGAGRGPPKTSALTLGTNRDADNPHRSKRQAEEEPTPGSSSSSSLPAPTSTQQPLVPEATTITSSETTSSPVPLTPDPLLGLSTVNDDVIDSQNISKVAHITCAQMECETITCEVATLMVDDTLTLDIVGYASVALLKRLKRRSVSLSTAMTFETTQACVTVNQDDTEVCEDDQVPKNDQVSRNDQVSKNDQVSRNDQVPKNDQVSRNDQVSKNDQAFNISAVTLVTIIERHEGAASLYSVEPWKIFLAILVALIGNIIIAAILWKVGFFKRKKRLTEDQRKAFKASQKRRTQTQEYKENQKGGAMFVG